MRLPRKGNCGVSHCELSNSRALILLHCLKPKAFYLHTCVILKTNICKSISQTMSILLTRLIEQCLQQYYIKVIEKNNNNVLLPGAFCCIFVPRQQLPYDDK